MLGSAGRARLRYAREGGGGGRQLGRVLNDECANERRVGPTRSSSRTGGTYRLSRRPACIGGPIAPLAGPGRHTSRRVRRLSRPQSVSKDLHPPAEAPRSQNFNDRFQSRENEIASTPHFAAARVVSRDGGVDTGMAREAPGGHVVRRDVLRRLPRPPAGRGIRHHRAQAPASDPQAAKG